MARYTVTHEGKMACFSSIPDGFITPFLPPHVYEAWWIGNIILAELRDKCERNTMPMEDAVEALCRNRSRLEAIAELEDAGIHEDFSSVLVDDHYNLDGSHVGEADEDDDDSGD